MVRAGVPDKRVRDLLSTSYADFAPTACRLIAPLHGLGLEYAFTGFLAVVFQGGRCFKPRSIRVLMTSSSWERLRRARDTGLDCVGSSDSCHRIIDKQVAANQVPVPVRVWQIPEVEGCCEVVFGVRVVRLRHLIAERLRPGSFHCLA